MGTKATTKKEVSASFFRGGISVTVESKHNHPRGGLATVIETANIWAPRRKLIKALRALINQTKDRSSDDDQDHG